MASNYYWWQTDIIYQIYPRSFQDSNRDGVGDLPGIISRLDYVQSLNAGTVWLSPIYPSPMHDFGYDVADTCDIHPLFGTLADFDRLLAEVHRRGMKLILDLVPNHTSDQHPWFLESRSSRDNSKRDWYIWRDPAPDGGPPNNWLSYFGGPAWTYDRHTGQAYLHQFLTQQPELNYRNPAVVAALLDTMRFWLDRGVDGFRVDVIWLMMKDPLFRDEPPNPAWDGVNPHNSLQHIYTANLPEVHGLIREMRKVLDAYDDRMMVGEIYMPNEDLITYYGSPTGNECHLPFNFQLISAAWDATTVRRMVDAYEAVLPAGAWPNWVLGNHDQHRLATRIGPTQARVANMLLLTLRGTPTCYYGDEIGLENVPIPPEMVQDPPAINQPEIAHLVGRDPERTPMQWDASPNAGFAPAGVRTWLPVAGDFTARNVAAQSQDPTSMLSFYRALTALRRSEPALTIGDCHSLDAGAPDVFAYLRSHGETRFLVVLNFGGEARRLDLSAVGKEAEIALSTEMTRPRAVVLSALDLGPNEGLILRLPADNKETQ
jgi:alpha-glucosidase